MVKRVRAKGNRSASDDFADIGTREDRQDLLVELEDALGISKENLDEHISTHSEIFYQVGKIVAVLASRRDKEKQNRDNVESQVDLNIRQQALSDSIKITEREIDARKNLNKEVQESRDAVLDLGEEINIWGALKEAYGHRNYMLKEITALYVTEYYATQSAGDGNKYKGVQADRGREAMSGERKRRSANS